MPRSPWCILFSSKNRGCATGHLPHKMFLAWKLEFLSWPEGTSGPGKLQKQLLLILICWSIIVWRNSVVTAEKKRIIVRVIRKPLTYKRD